MASHGQPAYNPVAQTELPQIHDLHTRNDSDVHENSLFSKSEGNEESSRLSSTTARKQDWGTGWRIPSLIVAPFVLATLLAIAHISFFLYLRDRTTNSIPQSYVTTASTILANTIGLCLRICLGTAFVQYLWYILRQSHYRTDKLDDLFSMRSDPLAMARSMGQRRAWALILLTMYLWLITVAVSFPPGAITVQPQTRTEMMAIPSFNNFNPLPLDQADDTVPIALQSQALNSMLWSGTGGTACAWSSDLKPGISIKVASVMTGGGRLTMPSPCGADCSYSLHFLGPYLQCSSTSQSFTTLITNEDRLPVYNTTSGLHGPDTAQSYSLNFSTTTYSAYAALTDQNTPGLVNGTQKNVTCTLSEADYEVINQYENNIHSLSHRTSNVRAIDLDKPTGNVCWSKTNSTFNDSISPEKFLKIRNNLAILFTFEEPLKGLYNGLFYIGDKLGGIQPGALKLTWNETYMQLDPTRADTPKTKLAMLSEGPEPELIAHLTPLATSFGTDVDDTIPYSRPDGFFEINEDVLNEMLTNVTLSMINLGMWNQTVEVRRNLTSTVYALSKPLNIALPYGLLLVLALPFLLLGLWSLHVNGVPAQDGGFYQILVTTSASEELHRAAMRNGCLGEPPEDLKSLKVRFGELINRNAEQEAGTYLGFGTKDEVVPISKGKAYGSDGETVRSGD